jgi:hypothetical protein
MTYKLKDLLVPVRLPGDEAVKRRRPNPGFSPEVQAELQEQLARCEAMLMENEMTPRSARTGRRAK